MNKVINYLTNFIIHTALGTLLLCGGFIILAALPLDSAAGELFYWGLIIAAIPLLIWGRRVVGSLIRLPWQLFKLIHSRWWSALAFWVGVAFMGLPMPVALFGFGFFVILPRLPVRGRRRINPASGLPMMNNSCIDIAGNLYGSDDD